MDQDYWLRQTAGKPLFPDLLWSRPETRSGAGKLAIIGGNEHGFAAVAEAYNFALKSGVGTARVLLPDSLQKTVGKLFPEAEFAASSPSGSFARQSLEAWLNLSLWADGVLLAGDLGRNSETAALIEQFLGKYSGQLTLTGDSLDYYTHDSTTLLDRSNTLLVPSFAQLQRLMAAGRLPYSLTSQQFIQNISRLHQLSSDKPIHIVVALEKQIVVAVDGHISSTPKIEPHDLEYAAAAAVWWLQNPSKSFEALTASLSGHT